MRLNPYSNLTPLHPGWGWKSRIFEIVIWTLSTLILGPLQLAYWALDKILSKVLP